MFYWRIFTIDSNGSKKTLDVAYYDKEAAQRLLDEMKLVCPLAVFGLQKFKKRLNVSSVADVK